MYIIYSDSINSDLRVTHSKFRECTSGAGEDNEYNIYWFRDTCIIFYIVYRHIVLNEFGYSIHRRILIL